jgi:hypothetical protein
MAAAMKIVGISMIRNDADIVELFVRHALRVLTEALIRSRPGRFDGVCSDHGSNTKVTNAPPGSTGTDGRQRP